MLGPASLHAAGKGALYAKRHGHSTAWTHAGTVPGEAQGACSRAHCTIPSGVLAQTRTKVAAGEREARRRGARGRREETPTLQHLELWPAFAACARPRLGAQRGEGAAEAEVSARQWAQEDRGAVIVVVEGVRRAGAGARGGATRGEATGAQAATWHSPPAAGRHATGAGHRVRAIAPATRRVKRGTPRVAR